MPPSPHRRLRLGIAGLGRAFTLMLPTLTAHPRLELVAAADPRPEARERFAKDHGARVYDNVLDLCTDPSVEAVYVATPHQHHAEHVIAAASRGKHVLVEKPMAIALGEASAMIAAAEKAGVHLVVGHSHSFDAPILRAREIIRAGTLGRVRMITAMNFTDFLYRPRRPEELDTGQGGGVIFSQAAHQVDIVRLLAGGRAKSVRAATGAWDPARPTEGAYSCLLSFEGGAFASLVYSGYAHFDSDELSGWIGELGQKKDPASYGLSRRSLAASDNELALKSARNYGGRDFRHPAATLHEHFGTIIVSCDKADLRPLPSGVMIYGDGEQRLHPLPAPAVPRTEVIDEIYDAVVHGKAALHGGEWALATMEVCLAMLRSGAEQKEIPLTNQTGLPT
jgi:phthalate 4,5-cis-dihydrodiol dehydrogenase